MGDSVVVEKCVRRGVTHGVEADAQHEAFRESRPAPGGVAAVPSLAASVLTLQRSAGNRAVSRLVGGGGGVAVPSAAAPLARQTAAPRRLARVPTKSGIKTGDYSWSPTCGWIDWGHANPTLAKALIANVQKGSDDLKSGGGGSGGSGGTGTMKAAKFGVVFSSASMEVRLARPLTPDEVLAVSLSMFKNLSLIFEIQQGWTDVLSGSSFSQEDLPSNLIGFYRAARGYSTQDIKRFCDAQDVEESLREFDRNSDFKKNPSFEPYGGGSWPPELSNIDDTKGASLYTVAAVTVGGPMSNLTLSSVYRIEGTIGDTDLFLFSVGGATFTVGDNVRVVPTYRVDTDRTSGRYGHVPFVEVRPYQESDAKALKAKGVDVPVYVPQPVLVPAGELEGGDVRSHLP